ncbi:MAG: nucleoside deaminase [Ilumatobacteraceae bacterium]
MTKFPSSADLLQLAVVEAQRGLAEGGVPIGAILVADGSTVLARGRNGTVQHDDHLLHAETAAVRAAGALSDYSGTTLVTTMTPCWYCAGLVRFLGIGTLIVGDGTTWSTEPAEWLAATGTTVQFLDDDDCVAMFGSWLATDPPAWSSLPVSADGNRSPS